MIRWPVQVRTGQPVGMESLPHYHVQSIDAEHCPAGRNHGSHCVLWDSRTRCALAGRVEEHTCCVPLAEPLGRRPREDAAKSAPQVDGLSDPELADVTETGELEKLNLAAGESRGPRTYLAMYQMQKRATQLQLERQKRQYQLNLQTQHKKGQQNAPSEPTPVYHGEPCQQNQHHNVHATPMAPNDSPNTKIQSPPYSQQGTDQGSNSILSLLASVAHLTHVAGFTSAMNTSSGCANCTHSTPSSTPTTIRLTINYRPSTN